MSEYCLTAPSDALKKIVRDRGRYMHKIRGVTLCASLGTPAGVFPGGAFVYFRILGLLGNYSRELQSPDRL